MESKPPVDMLPPAFLDVDHLIAQSQPGPRKPWGWYILGVFGLLIVMSSVAGRNNPELGQVFRVMTGFIMLLVIVGLGVVAKNVASQQQEETARTDAIDEMVQLRQWNQAAALLQATLSQPVRNPLNRLQCLVYLAAILSRFHRFEDVLSLLGYLMDRSQYIQASSTGLKLMKAMATLHSDHLFDADRAISEIRREAPDSAGLALVEMYRDIRTGHPEEALQIFAKRQEILRQQMGHRIADAYGLAARAHQVLEQDDQAAIAWANATRLSPPLELVRRYPELASVREAYAATPHPLEAA